MVFDATLGGTTANSYVTLVKATDLLSGRLDTAVWFEIPDTMAQREQALMHATSLLETYAHWYGLPATTTQALAWPQTGQRDPWGRLVLPTVIPVAVQQATAVYALALLQEAHAASGAATATSSTDLLIKSKKIGDMTITYQDVSSASVARKQTSPQLAVPAEVRALLRPYGTMAGSMMVPLVRT